MWRPRERRRCESRVEILHLVMSSATGAHLFVGRIGGEATTVANSRTHHSRHAPEALLGPPKATSPKDNRLDARWIWGLNGGAGNVMPISYFHCFAAAFQGLRLQHHRRAPSHDEVLRQLRKDLDLDLNLTSTSSTYIRKNKNNYVTVPGS